MTYLGMTLDAAPRAFGWGHVANWVRHLPPESAVMRWAAQEATKRKEASQGIGGAKGGRQSFGRGAVRVSDFDSWYYGGD